jgi:ABC-type amino acid transport substrate-binding protein
VKRFAAATGAMRAPFTPRDDAAPRRLRSPGPFAHSCPVPNRVLALLAIFLIGSAGSAPLHAASARAGVLRVAVNEANGRPFAIYDASGRLEGGLARDVIDPLAASLGLRAQYLNLPRARVVPWLRAGRIDGACFLAPEWVPGAQALRWSPVLFHIRQVIVSPAGAEAVVSPRALFGRRLGTLLNYTYPELQPYFADQRILRSDAPSFASNIAKLERGRIDAFLNDDIAALFAARSGALRQPVRIDPLWAPENPVHCAFSTAFDARVPRWRGQLQAQVDAGQVQAAIAAYTGGRRASVIEAAPR